jgi:formylglycine-generating enzyme required for sulfatase activity
MSLNDAGGFEQAIHKQDSFGNDFCYVQKGPFYYGDFNTVEEVLAPFYIGRFPITKAQFLYFVDETGYDYSTLHRKIMDKLSPHDDCPATPISWWDAKYYVRWLRKVTGEYYSLPIEGEWEAACRGYEGNVFPWGNEMPTDVHACFSTAQKRTTTDLVGSHPVGDSPCGCSDMIGNVWEWCLDQIDEDNEIHVIRGGGAQDDMGTIKSTVRSFISPASMRMNFAGFRLVYLPGYMFEEYCSAQQ